MIINHFLISSTSFLGIFNCISHEFCDVLRRYSPSRRSRRRISSSSLWSDSQSLPNFFNEFLGISTRYRRTIDGILRGPWLLPTLSRRITYVIQSLTELEALRLAVPASRIRCCCGVISFLFPHPPTLSLRFGVCGVSFYAFYWNRVGIRSSS